MGQGQAGRHHRPGWVVVVGGMVVVMVVAREWAKGRQGVTIVQGGYQGCGGVWVVVLDFVWTTMAGFWQHELPGLGLFSAIFFDDFPIPVPGVQEAQVSGWKDGSEGGSLRRRERGGGPGSHTWSAIRRCVWCAGAGGHGQPMAPLRRPLHQVGRRGWAREAAVVWWLWQWLSPLLSSDPPPRSRLLP